jgi:hypothetical protein
VKLAKPACRSQKKSLMTRRVILGFAEAAEGSG